MINLQAAYDTSKHDYTFLVYALIENVRLQRTSNTELLDLVGKESDKSAIRTE